MTDLFYTDVAVHGNNILCRLTDSDGKQQLRKIQYEPSLFVPAPRESQDTAEYHSMEGLPLVKKKFPNIRDCREFMEQYEGVTGFRMFGQKNFDFQFIAHTFGSTSNSYHADKIRVAYVDIEVFSGHVDDAGNVVAGPFPEPAEAKYPISAITVYASHTGTATVFAMPYRAGERVSELMQHGCNVDLHEYEAGQEFALLSEFMNYWESQQFNCWTGWNIEGFDCPYMVNRVNYILGDKAADRFSPWGMVKARKVRSAWDEFTTYNFVGCPMLDYQQVYQKHTYTNQSSYKLGHIAYVELGETKLSYDEERSLSELYVRNHTKYVNYNIKDTMLVKRLNDKLGLMEVMFALAYSSFSNYGDGLGTVQPWSALSYTSLYIGKIIPEILKPQDEDVEYEGAYVKEVVPGFYPWTISVDLNSLYPHLVQQYNMGPETLVRDPVLRNEIIDALIVELQGKAAQADFLYRSAYTGLIVALQQRKPNIVDEMLKFAMIPGERFDVLVERGVNMTPNLQFFRNDKMSFLSKKFREIYALRKVTKKKMLKYEQYLADAKAEAKNRGLLKK